MNYVSFPHRPCERCDHADVLVCIAGVWVCKRCAERIDRQARVLDALRARDEQLVASGKKA